ncbi:MAG: hypothetical protein V3T86_04210 [Planctomycetota bacterium]
MNGFKKLLLTVLGLTFIGGLGTGAFVGTLLASSKVVAQPEDRRIDDFREILDVDELQVERLRRIFARHQIELTGLRRTIQQENGRRYNEVHELCRQRIREILTDEQRALYDQRRGQ